MSGHYRVITGDCLQVMAGMDAGSVDAVVTDPPYGLGFMGKSWDYAVPGVEFWAEALRVAKPGSHLLAFGGTRLYHRMTVAIEDAGWEIRDCLMWVYGTGFPKSHNGEWGGTALKPAWEPIVMARKPLDGTVAANHEKHGTGGLNIDGCRVETDEDLNGGGYSGGTPKTMFSGLGRLRPDQFVNPSGRWPANLIHDGSDEATAGMGGAARYFYCPKASKGDRDGGVDTPFRPRPTLGSGIGGQPDQQRANNRNHHPTVKPTDLMAYLCRLVTPDGGTVLDPFNGSGSTGKAAVREGFNYIGIELDPEYAAIATARIKHQADATPLYVEAG